MSKIRCLHKYLKLSTSIFYRIILILILILKVFPLHTPLLQGCLQDEELLQKLDKIVADCQPPVAYQTSYY